jgi:glutamate racemase
MPDARPIGLFDSGVGGLSVWRAVVEHLPHEATIYFADSAHCPYGPRPAEQVITLATAITHFLLTQNCKLIVVACNTASAAALASLRAAFALPIVGMEPAIKPAAVQTQTGHVGVLATAGTLQGSLFQNTSRFYANGVQVHVQVGEGLVEKVEAGQFDSPDTAALLRTYLEPMLAAQVDQIVLGCTHYPLLIPLIEQIVQGKASVIDPAQAVARQVARVLDRHNLAAAPPTDAVATAKFYTTGSPELLQNLVQQLTGQPIALPQVVELPLQQPAS